MRKRILSVLLAVVMITAFVPMTAMAETGTSCDGGIDCTHEAAIDDMHYDSLSDALSVSNGKTVVLLKDIDASSWTSVQLENMTLDGNEKTIYNLTTPFISSAKNELNVKDLTISGANIEGTANMEGILISFVSGGADVNISGVVIVDSVVGYSDDNNNSYVFASAFIAFADGNGSEITIDGCKAKNITVNGKEAVGILVGGTYSERLTITNTTIEGTNSVTDNVCRYEGQAGIAIGCLFGKNAYIDIDIEGNTTLAPSGENAQRTVGGVYAGNLTITGGTYPADPSLVDYIATGSDSKIDGTVKDDNGDTFEGTVKVGNVEYASLRNALAAVGGMTGDVTVEFLDDMDLDGWTPADLSRATYDSLTIDGKGKTITNLSDSLFLKLLAKDFCIKDITFERTDIGNLTGEGNMSGSGIIVPIGPSSGKFRVERVKVSGGEITSDDYTGALFGYTNTLTIIKNCSVESVNLSGEGTGAFVGHANGNITLENCKVGGNEVKSTNNAAKIGSAIGTINANNNNNIDVTEMTLSRGKYNDEDATLNIIGRVVDISVTYTGGEYFTDPKTASVNSGTINAEYIVKNGKYYVPEIEVNEVKYATMEDAVAAAQEGDEITLIGYVEEDFEVDKDLTINLGDKTLIGEITVSNDANITIKGNSDENEIKLVVSDGGNRKLIDWYTDADFTESNKVADGEITEAVAGGTTYYAKWAEIERIEVTTLPTKIEYEKGETFEADGMVVKAIYSDGSAETVTGYTITPDGELTSSDKTITVEYNGFTAEIEINIISNDDGGTPVYDTTSALDPDNFENGEVTANFKYPSAGVLVTLTITPDEGYEVGEITIADANGKEIEVIDNGDGTYSFRQPESEIEIDVEFVEIEEEIEDKEDKPEEEPKAEIILTIGNTNAIVNGEIITNDVAPVIRNGRTMLPIRFIVEELGGKIEWNDELKKVTITKGDLVIEIFIGSPFALVNGNIVELDSPAFIENGRTYLPVRFVADYLGADVEWIDETKTVIITEK